MFVFLRHPTHLRRLLTFALFTHAMWFFGNLYEGLVFIPNGLRASREVFAQFNAYFAVTKPYWYYVPLTHLGALALLAAAVGQRRAPRGEARVELRLASLASGLAIVLTVFIVVHYNTRLWLGDVRGLDDQALWSLTLQWGLWNLLRLVLVGVAGAGIFRAYTALLRLTVAPPGAGALDGLVIPAMTTPIIRTRPQRGRSARDASSSLASQPGRTVPRRPRAARVVPATSRGVCASPIVIDALAAKPLWMGPGADASTSTLWGFSSSRNASANDWI